MVHCAVDDLSIVCTDRLPAPLRPRACVRSGQIDARIHRSASAQTPAAAARSCASTNSTALR